MPEISWIKLKTKMFDDEKIQLIEAMPEADAILVIWIKLLIQAGKTNSNGYILLSENIPYSPEMISTIFRRPLQIVKFALKVLTDLSMIEVTKSNVICISNWEKHQNIEGLDRVREQNRLRQKKFRDQKLLLEAENESTVTLRNAVVTQQNKNKILEEEKELFDNARKIFPGTKRGVDTEFNNLKKKHKDYAEILPLLIPAIEAQIKWRDTKEFRPQWKNFQTWINQRCWEDELPTINGTGYTYKEAMEIDNQLAWVKKEDGLFYKP